MPTAAVRATAASILPLLVLVFFLSGATGLIYQVLWLRLLGLVFGVTVYAASTVWAAFMAGLAFGSVIGGRIGDRTARPLVWFGAAEAAVGLSALATPAALDLLLRLYADAYPSLPTSPLAVTTVRGAMAFAVLLVPTTMMGATLPLVIRSTVGRSTVVAGRVGLLYGTNTLGAIAGTLLAGLYLIPTLGIASTFHAAALINVSAGLVVLVLGLGRGDGLEAEPAAAVAATPPTIAPDPGGVDHTGLTPVVRHLVLATFFVSGLASLALEVLWFRMVVLVARPTVYAYSVMLASVLVGIALGSYLVTPWLRRPWPWLRILVGLELAMAFSALLSFNLLGDVDRLTRLLQPYVAAVLPTYLAHPIAASLPTIVPTCLLMGMAFPIGLGLWVEGARAGRQVASRLGGFYGVNLCGAILGSLLAGFLLLPAIGGRSSLIAVAALLLLSGIALLVAPPGPRRRRLAVAGAVVLVFAASAASIPDPFGIYLAVRYPAQPAIWRQEGVQSTVSVHAYGGRRSMMLDGNHQASDAGSMVAVHRRIAHLPLVIHPEARDVLVIGLGGGATAGAASIHEGVELDVVELSPEVVAAADFFTHINFDLLRRPNVHLRVDDGRNHLMLGRKKYDVITADIILPIHVGANNVYSREYFSLVRRALKPGGLAMQWVWGTEAEYKTIARTFLSVFPHTTVWTDGSLLLGAVEPLTLKKSDFTWKQQVAGRREALAALGVDSFERLQAEYLAGPDELRRYLGDGPVLTDDRPLAEYFLSLPRDRDPDLSSLRGDVRRHVAD